jgi:hypothetical protein
MRPNLIGKNRNLHEFLNLCSAIGRKNLQTMTAAAGRRQFRRRRPPPIPPPPPAASLLDLDLGAGTLLLREPPPHLPSHRPVASSSHPATADLLPTSHLGKRGCVCRSRTGHNRSVREQLWAYRSRKCTCTGSLCKIA